MQAVGQKALTGQMADSEATSFQKGAKNLNVPVRIFSEGDDGDVEQSNDSTALSAALNAAARTIAGNPDALINQVISHYQILERLGAGGMGVVYKARQISLDRPVAVKVLRFGPEGGTLGRALSARMQREARAMARLKHPNVVAVYDVGEIGERPFITMELVSGTTLSAWPVLVVSCKATRNPPAGGVSLR